MALSFYTLGRYLGDDTGILYRYPTVLVDFGPLNSSRAPNYHRLDLGIHFKKTRSWAVRTISAGVYNSYGRRNPFYIYAKLTGPDGGSASIPVPVEVKRVTLFRWIPSLSYQLQF